MEYPGIVFDGIDDKAKTLFWISAHEIGHSWFPMIVGFDERRDAWMDEGFNTFIDVYEIDEFDHGDLRPQARQRICARRRQPRSTRSAKLLADPEAPPILSPRRHGAREVPPPGDLLQIRLGLILLREQILGPERFDPAFRKFIADWAFKHPKPGRLLPRHGERRRRGSRATGGAAGTSTTGSSTLP